MGTWQKSWVPFVLAAVGMGVYFGLFSEEQAGQLRDVVVPAAIAFIQAVLVYFVPNKGA